jgi:hypothetical protein
MAGGWTNCIMRSFITCTIQLLNLVTKSRGVRWARNVVLRGEVEEFLRNLDQKAKGKKTLGGPGRRCEDNIGMSRG